MNQDSILVELEEAIEREKDILLKTSGDEHNKAVDNYIKLLETHNKLVKTEYDHEVGIERIIADRDIGEKANEIKENQLLIEQVNMEKTRRLNTISTAVSLASLAAMQAVSINFEKGASFTSLLGRNVGNEIPKRLLGSTKM